MKISQTSYLTQTCSFIPLNKWPVAKNQPPDTSCQQDQCVGRFILTYEGYMTDALKAVRHLKDEPSFKSF